jgi:hypothetical protein
MMQHMRLRKVEPVPSGAMLDRQGREGYSPIGIASVPGMSAVHDGVNLPALLHCAETDLRQQLKSSPSTAANLRTWRHACGWLSGPS